MVSLPRAAPPPAAEDAALRARALGIPADAARVLVVAETSHWDPQWLLTSREYFRWIVDRQLRRVVDELEREPRRVYGVECTFFLRLFWEAHPALRPRVRRLVDEGRLRLLGSGVTTPDTVVTSGEAILRDYLCGQEWLRQEGLASEPRVAFLPDSFGHSPALPSLYAALGVDAVAICRVDGMYFPGTDRRPPGAFPRPGSTAAQLHAQHSLDAVWRDAAGAEVLVHWMAFGYGMGDLIGHRGLTRWMGLPLAVRARGATRVSRQLGALAARLAPLSRTRYLYCPVGFDFTPPVRGLGALIDRHNATTYQDTGLFVVSASFDDYAALIGAHRDELPMVTLDPSPCFQGFPAARTGLKREIATIVDRLLDAEASEARRGLATPDLRALWDRAVVTNHHDFVTGTSTDRVVRREQRPHVAAIAASLDERGVVTPVAHAARPRPLRQRGDLVEIESERHVLTLDAAAGGVVRQWHDAARGLVVLGDGGLDVLAYRDGGGLWRLGHEIQGAAWHVADRASAHRAEIVAAARDDGATIVTVRGRVRGRRLERTLVLHADGRVELQVAALAARGHTLTMRLPFAAPGRQVRTTVPGGMVERPRLREGGATFWPVTGRTVLRGPDGRGVAFTPAGAAALALDEAGAVEWIVARNAPRERVRGLPLLGFPVHGREDGTQHAAATVERLPTNAPDEPPATVPARFAGIDLDRDDVELMAVKPAWRGAGVIVRVRARRPGVTLRVRAFGRELAGAWRCDARERDRRPLLVSGAWAVVPDLDPITTVRLVPREDA